MKNLKPTLEISQIFQDLYDQINDQLFAGDLAPCMIVFSRRKKGTYGYYRRKGWKRQGEAIKVPEICLNIECILESQADEQEVVQTLAHEMCHHWQCTSSEGKPSRAGYHNRQFADKMKSIGLYPSSTGKPGGKETGQNMGDYLVEGGPLEKLYKELKADGWKIPYANDKMYRTIQQSAGNGSGSVSATIPEDAPEPKKNKIKYSCPGCEINVWGKPDLRIACMDCGCQLEGGS